MVYLVLVSKLNPRIWLMSRGAFKQINRGMCLKLYGLVSFEHWIQLRVYTDQVAVSNIDLFLDNILFGK